MLVREMWSELFTPHAEASLKWSPFYKNQVPDAIFGSIHFTYSGKPSPTFLSLQEDYLF